ncbi:hypothetical protein FEN17_20385 [Dyadobacter luticola]|uniref:Uncharacterized protein n=2 Tax=Dyadobacter luticola TaxID=1979387 RepID=A0A5R9KRV6_9BACT|nr:hypothetical protein FEN17_20385 [Dyadobacter luticola]
MLFLSGYDLDRRFYEKSDFGSLHQVLFTTPPMQVEICFWELGWLGITVKNYENNEQILHILLEPNQELEKDSAFRELRDLLQINTYK